MFIASAGLVEQAALIPEAHRAGAAVSAGDQRKLRPVVDGPFELRLAAAFFLRGPRACSFATGFVASVSASKSSTPSQDDDVDRSVAANRMSWKSSGATAPSAASCCDVLHPP